MQLISILLSILSSPLHAINYSNRVINYIYEHNHNNNYTYTLELNKFAIDDYQDYNDTNTQYQLLNGSSNHTTFIIDDDNGDDIISVPDSIDWRDKNVVTPVKDQGKCGSCWSFSATGAIESINAIDTGILKNVSEQQLMDCSTDYGNHGCRGGLMDNAFKFVIDNGICSEEDYPYIGLQGQCNPCKPIMKIESYKDIIQNNEKILKRVVAQQPVSVAIQANLLSFRYYSSGIYSDQNCGNNIDHGVLIIGYGYDDTYDMDYWTIKNSWGSDWGENGYIRIQRNINNSSGLCGIALQPSIPILYHI